MTRSLPPSTGTCAPVVVTGEKHELKAGDAFVVPAGFEGIWEVSEPTKKWYAIFEPKS